MADQVNTSEYYVRPYVDNSEWQFCVLHCKSLKIDYLN